MASFASILTFCILAGARAERAGGSDRAERAAGSVKLAPDQMGYESLSKAAALNISVKAGGELTAEETDSVADLLIDGSEQSGLPPNKGKITNKLGKAIKIVLATDGDDPNKIVGAVAVKNKLNGTCNLGEIGSFVVDRKYRKESVSNKLLTELLHVIEIEQPLTIYYMVSVTNYPSLSILAKTFPHSSVAGYLKSGDRWFAVMISPESDQCDNVLKHEINRTYPDRPFRETIDSNELEEAIKKDKLAPEMMMFLYTKMIRSNPEKLSSTELEKISSTEAINKDKSAPEKMMFFFKKTILSKLQPKPFS